MEFDILPSIGPAVQRELPELAAGAVARAREFLLSFQRADRHWCAELESNPAITAEYVLMCQMLGLRLGERRERIARYLTSRQNADGSWGIAESWEGDVSTSVETYLALRILGLERHELPMMRAERFILRNGGVGRARIFTRVFLALFGLFPWSVIPSIPPELILVPASAPVNIYALASWARSTMVPLFVIFHHRPVYALPNGRSAENDWLDHLWLDARAKQVAAGRPQRSLRKTLFGAADLCLRGYERIRIGALRRLALEKCTSWILEHQERTGDWAGIFPPMINGVIALTLQGYGVGSDPVRRGLEAIERFAWEDEAGLRIQACESPVWDTALSTIALVDCGVNPESPEIGGAVRWMLERQIRTSHGDWKVNRPELEAGGWSFEHFNTWYPDVDDTAAVVLMLLKQDPASASSEPVRRAVTWMAGMQNRDGGWAAFDVDNDKEFLNDIPFSDMDSLCDPSTPDVTGRVLEAFGLWLRQAKGAPGKEAESLRSRVRSACDGGVAYLRRSQEEQGPWYGRWGVNYVYGTSNVLCGLAELGIPGGDPMVNAALAWLGRVQNRDGGWGESLASYSDPARWMGRGESTPSQTAWALMGLLSYLPASGAG